MTALARDDADTRTARVAAVRQTTDALKEVLGRGAVGRPELEEAKALLVRLAEKRELFGAEDFPLPGADAEKNNALYLLAAENEPALSLYLQVSGSGLDVPPHNHKTWAIIAGIDGVEENRFYERTAEGPQRSGGQEIGPGGAVAFAPEDLHSIHIHGQDCVLNFHMYGIPLDKLYGREYWHAGSGEWRLFPVQQGIVDRRDG